MNVLITGAAGFIGRKLTQALLQRGEIGDGRGRAEPIDRIVLFDVVAAKVSAAGAGAGGRAPSVEVRANDISDPAVLRSIVSDGIDLAFHLAAIVSANAEEDFDLGYRVNMTGTLNLLEACRATGRSPRVVYASSCAAYGGELPAKVPETWNLTPQTSYGAQKVIGELLLADYRRKGFVDGRGLRLPTIVVRSGAPNKAASTFASSIIREPVAGRRAVCPVRPESRMYILSPRRAVEALIHAAELAPDALGVVPTLTLPGIDASIGELVAALSRVAGAKIAELIDWQPDERIQKIVDGWPAYIDAARARSLGFRADDGPDEIIRAHIEDPS